MGAREMQWMLRWPQAESMVTVGAPIAAANFRAGAGFTACS
jgi:hypothetical protein